MSSSKTSAQLLTLPLVLSSCQFWNQKGSIESLCLTIFKLHRAILKLATLVLIPYPQEKINCLHLLFWTKKLRKLFSSYGFNFRAFWFEMAMSIKTTKWKKVDGQNISKSWGIKDKSYEYLLDHEVVFIILIKLFL